MVDFVVRPDRDGCQGTQVQAVSSSPCTGSSIDDRGRVVVNDNTFQAACFPNDCVAVFPLFRGILYNHLLFTFCPIIGDTF